MRSAEDGQGAGRLAPRNAMEKIERLAKLDPRIDFLTPHSVEMFKILRGFVVLDWILKHPNDLGALKAEAKFAGLMEKAAEVAEKIQAETEKEMPVAIR